MPQQVRWPPPNLVHWERLHEVADEARERVIKAYMQMDEIYCNGDLSPEGKERQRRKVAAQAIEDFEASKALSKAHAAVDHVMAMSAGKVGLAVEALPTSRGDGSSPNSVRPLP